METKHNLRKALLVADGGSTKTDWCLAVPHREPQLFRTRGLNPALLEPPAIREILQTELLPRLAPHLQGPETETHIYYYGAGCLPSVCDKMGQALTGLFPRSTAEVHSDLLGAARSRHCLHFGHRFQFLPLRRTGHCATCVSVGIHLRGRRQRHSFRQTPDRRLAQRTFRRRTKP